MMNFRTTVLAALMAVAAGGAAMASAPANTPSVVPPSDATQPTPGLDRATTTDSLPWYLSGFSNRAQVRQAIQSEQQYDWGGAG